MYHLKEKLIFLDIDLQLIGVQVSKLFGKFSAEESVNSYLNFVFDEDSYQNVRLPSLGKMFVWKSYSHWLLPTNRKVKKKRLGELKLFNSIFNTRSCCKT